MYKDDGDSAVPDTAFGRKSYKEELQGRVTRKSYEEEGKGLPSRVESVMRKIGRA